MKISNILLSTTLLSVGLMAAPDEGKLVLPPKAKVQPAKTTGSLDSKSEDEVIKLLDDVNKKRIEFEEMKAKQREEQKRKDKDYVLEQLKKDNSILEEKLKTLSIQERELQKQDDLEKLKNKTLEGGEYRDAAKLKAKILQMSKKSIPLEYKVDGEFTVNTFGDSKSVKVHARTMAVVLELIMSNKKDIEMIDKQIEYYEFVSKNTNIDFLKEHKKFEEIYDKKDYISLQNNYTDDDILELTEGDVVYDKIIIEDITPKSYVLKYKK